MDHDYNFILSHTLSPLTLSAWTWISSVSIVSVSLKSSWATRFSVMFSTDCTMLGCKQCEQ